VSTEDYTTYVAAAWPRLFRTAYALTGDVASADELLQTTLVKVYLHWRTVVRAGSPDAYVRRVMYNQAASVWRTRLRRPEVLAAEPRTDLAQTGAALDDEFVTSDELWQLVHGLPVRQRAVIVLRYYEDLSEREIADVLGMAAGTVKSLSSAAMTKLRERLAEATHDRSTAGDNR
jgi:RNA polymerase sigma-70 factor (sigma-E family)